MNDTTCPHVHSDASKQGGKYCALTHATDNGCTIPATIPTTTSGWIPPTSWQFFNQF